MVRQQENTGRNGEVIYLGKLEGQTLGMDRYLVTTKDEFVEMLEELKGATEIAFDTETTGLNYLTCDIVGASFSDGNKGWYVPIGHTTEEEQIPKFLFIDKIKPIMENEEIPKIAHNFKFDYQVYKMTCGIEIKGQWLDTMIASWLNDENQRHGLKALSKRFLKYDQTDFKDVAGKKVRFQDAELELAGKYACDDAIVTYRLMQYLAPKLHEQELTKVFFEVEMPFIKVLADMELEGVPIDKEYLEQTGEWVKEEMMRSQQEFWDAVGYPVNLNSPKQLGEALFEKMKCPVLELTSTGKPSTSAEVLEALARKGYSSAKSVARYKKLSKIYGTYIVGLLNQIQKDGKLHGSFNHTGTVTGRLSSSNPNLQNIPSRDEETQIRRAFIAPKGYDIINADYSQIELRVMAHFSQDKGMLKAYEEGKDLHIATASLLSKIPYDEFVKAKKRDEGGEELSEADKKCLRLRGLAKSVNFGIIYGMGANSLAEGEGISLAEAKKFISDYFKGFSGVDDFIKKTHLTTKKYGYIRTLTGRKRRLPDIWSDDYAVVASCERQSVNSKIQGSAGDIMKLAMLKLHYEVLPKYDAKLVIQVHDEILIFCPEQHTEECMKEVKEAMINVVKLRVPLDVDIRGCKNWAEGH